MSKLLIEEKSYVQAELPKVSEFQKQIFLFLLEPKNEQNYFLISALGVKSKKWRHFIILIRGYLT